MSGRTAVSRRHRAGLALFAALTLASPGSAQDRAPSVEDAAGHALQQCIAHANGQGAIAADNAAQLAGNGLIYEAEPPPFLAAIVQGGLGTGSFARAPSDFGQIWAIGYDSGACGIVAIAEQIPDVEARLRTILTITPGFAAEPHPAEAGVRWAQWRARQGDHALLAQMRVNAAAAGQPGLILVTLIPQANGS